MTTLPTFGITEKLDFLRCLLIKPKREHKKRKAKKPQPFICPCQQRKNSKDYY